MRIIKLAESEFPTLRDVHNFFSGLGERKPPGQFSVPKGWIARESFDIGEQLVFTYQTLPYYTAYAASGIEDNMEEDRESYPVFFQIDLSTLREVDHPLIKRDTLRNLAKGRGWNHLPGSARTQTIWTELR